MKKLLFALPVLLALLAGSTAFASDDHDRNDDQKKRWSKSAKYKDKYKNKKKDCPTQQDCTCDISREELDALISRVDELESLNRCLASTDCGFGEYCEKLKGDCEGYGTCETRPQLCIEIYSPVCGCNGQTYGNECEAAASGIGVAHDGECPPPPTPTCQDNSECSVDEFCAKTAGDCAGTGECLAKPPVCPDVWAPVCGCDGNTYGNKCEAYSVGVNVSHGGECSPPPAQNCLSSSDCLNNEFCDKNTGDCGGQGICSEKPMACANIYDPVCGCDDQTYPNECFAQVAGVSIVHTGQCPPATPFGCLNNFECGLNGVCQKNPGDCGGVGQCLERPEVCPMYYDPVCGCDGRTYGNSCEALSAGVNVAYPGVCSQVPM